MNNIHDMLNISTKFHDKITKFCAPLEKLFGVSQFYHARIMNSGYLTSINLNREWEEFFFSDISHIANWPDVCNPLKINGGVRLLQAGENINTNNIFEKAKKKYLIHFSIQIVEKFNQGSDIYGFALKSSDLNQHIALISDIPLLRLFVKRFQEEFRSLYSVLDNYKIDLVNLIGTSFNNPKFPAISNTSMRDQFLQKMKIEFPMPLTEKENEIIKHLIKGYSASQIACELFLSTRTVEHHLEKIKEKFRSSSKSNLIQQIQDLESIGYFEFS